MPASIQCLHRRAGLLTTAVALAGALAGCGSLSGTPERVAGVLTPYKIQVVQGNFVSREQVEQLRPGMSRDQVRGLLGTPLLASVFHADRWDYVFTLRRQGVPSQSYRLTTYFKGDALDRFEGDTMPTEAEFVASMDVRRRSTVVPLLEASESQLEKQAIRAPAASVPAAAAPVPQSQPAPTSYPPLEAPAR